ncbi:glycosidase [Vibrio sp. SCSIO 43136]|uniref:glycosidase n=1 Tax=Vibrio sp. SCSIO 43136 TaxID=2819101 RepID=UPI002075F8CF|nr:glycosidase [Vibrio sp. SCSIO 43136]USD67060.1 glycosidase [Vibrio sp. SCSIO 43136]
MKYKLIASTLFAALVTGCASTDDSATEAVVAEPVAAAPADARFSDCTIADSTKEGPVSAKLYVVGSFPDADWQHKDSRVMSYKGDGIYQAVIEEKAGNVSLQFAASSWAPQFTAGGKKLMVGQENTLRTGGYGADTKVAIPQDGKYVWSIQLSEDKKPLKAMIALCK